MCRMLAYCGSVKTIGELIYCDLHNLITQSICAQNSISAVNGDGFGLGWFDINNNLSTKQIFRYVDTMPAWSDINLKTLSEYIKSPLFFAHVRAATDSETTRPNCHPYINQDWLFMNNGQVGEYLKIRREIEKLIPDDIYPKRCGNNDSEAIFLALFAEDINNNPHTATINTLRKIRHLQKNINDKALIRHTSVMARYQNGTPEIYVCRYASDCSPPSLYYHFDEKNNNLIIASECCQESPEGWNEVPVNCAIIYQKNELIINKLPADL